MLFFFTSLVDFTGMLVALWMALYLFSRGYRSRVTLRAVVVLLALSAFFLGAFINLYQQIPGMASGRATLLIVSLCTWFDLTHRLLPEATQKRFRWSVYSSYFLGLITVVLLIGTKDSFVGEVGNVLWVGRMGVGPPYIIYGLTQAIVTGGILYNFAAGARVGVGVQNRYFLAASILSASTVLYGIIGLAITPPLPRLVQDLLIFTSIVLLGISVGRYQTLVERRSTLQDYPISALSVFIIMNIYILIAWAFKAPPIALILVGALAVLTHSLSNLVSDLLHRLRERNENDYRRQLRLLENDQDVNLSLQARLMEGLNLLSKIVDATGGFIAVRKQENYIVSATHSSLPTGTKLPIADLSCEDVCEAPEALSDRVAWLAPGFGGGEQVAVVGIGCPKTGGNYSENDIDILAEAADRIGTIIYLNDLQPGEKDNIRLAASKVRSNEGAILASSQDLITSLVTNPDPKFVKLVEGCLRNLSDYITLGQSPLADNLGIHENTQIEQGRAIRQVLVEAIDMLKPGEARPPEPLPREWYSYTILHDAYIEDVPNREIMARLYISEGTFNRSRKKALRGIARFLVEKKTRK